MHHFANACGSSIKNTHHSCPLTLKVTKVERAGDGLTLFPLAGDASDVASTSAAGVEAPPLVNPRFLGFDPRHVGMYSVSPTRANPKLLKIWRADIGTLPLVCQVQTPDGVTTPVSDRDPPVRSEGCWEKWRLYPSAVAKLNPVALLYQTAKYCVLPDIASWNVSVGMLVAFCSYVHVF